MEGTCSAASQARDEPMLATASRVQRWLLVEHPGPWGPETVPAGRLAPEVARSLAAAAQDGGARLLLLRRPAGIAGSPGRWVFAVDSRPGRERVLATHVDVHEQLVGLDVPWDGAGDGWQQVDEPLLLVCTHGRHDLCCALRGRPVAAALAQRYPQTTWECTHIGGDRFAANLLVLPAGFYFGRVAADEAVQLVDSLRAGDVPVEALRGRSSLSLPAQAAQHFARVRLARTGLDDLAPIAQTGVETDVWRVRLAGTAGPDVDVVVRFDRAGAPHLLTCDSVQAKVAPSFACVSVDPVT